jgi:hypothetical protein
LGRCFVGVGEEVTVSSEENSLLGGSHNQQLGSHNISSVSGAGRAAGVGDWVLTAIRFAGVGIVVPVGVGIAAAGRDTCGFAGGVGNGAAGHTGIGVVVPDEVCLTFAVKVIESETGRSGEALAGNLGSVQQVDVEGGWGDDEIALFGKITPLVVNNAGARGVGSGSELAVRIGIDVAEAAISFGSVSEGTFGTVTFRSR